MSKDRWLELCQWVALMERKAADLKAKAQRDTEMWFREGERAAYADMRSRLISFGLAAPEHFVPEDVGGYSIVPALGDRRRVEEEIKKPTVIFVTVRGGVADVDTDTVPDGVYVEIVDFDNIGAGDPWPSEEAKERYSEEK